jgi:hypothetical protein
VLVGSLAPAADGRGHVQDVAPSHTLIGCAGMSRSSIASMSIARSISAIDAASMPRTAGARH